MFQQTFVGDKPVDQLPENAKHKIPDEQLNELESKRDPAVQPGANVRAGIATRDPDAVDTRGRGGQGNTEPQADPVI